MVYFPDAYLKQPWDFRLLYSRVHRKHKHKVFPLSSWSSSLACACSCLNPISDPKEIKLVMVCAVFSRQFCWISGALVISGVQHETAAALSIHSLSEMLHVRGWDQLFLSSLWKMEALFHNLCLLAALSTESPSWSSPSPSLVCSKVNRALFI